MNSPNLNGIYGMATNPLRQVFMMGVVWFLVNQRKNSYLNLLEVGSWGGASALTWGQGLELYNNSSGRITCIDAWSPYYAPDTIFDELSKDINDALLGEEPYNTFLKNIKYIHPEIDVTMHKGWSSDTFPKLEQNSFDLIYIDGDHSYENVLGDINGSCKLIKEGGVICGDDLELQGHQVETSIIEKVPYLDKYMDQKSGIVFHPGVTKAVEEIFGGVSSWSGFWAIQKVNGDWRKISLMGMPPNIPRYIKGKKLIELKALMMKHGIL